MTLFTPIYQPGPSTKQLTQTLFKKPPSKKKKLKLANPKTKNKKQREPR